MEHWRRIVAACTGMLCVLSSPEAHAAGGEGLVVRIKEGAADLLKDLKQLEGLGELGLNGRSFLPLVDFEFGDPALAERLGLDRYYRIELPGRAEVDQAIRALAAHEDIFETIEREYWGSTAGNIPDDPYFPIQWNLRNIGQGVECPVRSAFPDPTARSIADISAVDAWGITTGSAGIIVAIVDSGVTQHIDLPPLRPGWAYDGLAPTDQCNHGTHVAGTIGALTDNGIGISGVMWNAGIVSVRVLQGCFGTDINYGRGIIWAADRAHISNSSLQYYTVGSFFKLAVQYAHQRGLVMVAATGNSGQVVAFPARLPGVIAVGATDYYDQVANFSNSGPQITLSAPGVAVYSLLPRTPVKGIFTGSGCLSGTSMASPHVAGVAGLIKTLEPLATHGRVKRILISTVDDRGPPGWDEDYGWGRLNAARALALAECYIDCNMDGTVDPDDIQCFINRFVDGHPYADLNDDGRLTSEDLIIFIDQFKQGCTR